MRVARSHPPFSSLIKVHMIFPDVLLLTVDLRERRRMEEEA